MIMRRRQLLKGCSAAALASGVLIGASRRSRAAWGELDPAMFPGTPPNCKVLEIFLYGGLSAWETFYHQPWVADPWFGLAGDVNELDWQCSGGPVTPVETRPFADDANGNTVHLGPATKPLWESHILDRMRVVALQHALPPHEAAIPLAMTGRRLGNPDLAGLGAAIQHHWSELAPRAQPYSYVVTPSILSFNDNVAAATAVGGHPALARPLKLEIGEGAAGLLDRLDRAPRAQADALWAAMRAEYIDRTRWGAGGPITRSAAVAAYEASTVSVLGAAQLAGLLQGAGLTPSDTQSCVNTDRIPFFEAPNATAASLRTAVKLLNDSTSSARYVCVVDNGLDSVGDGTGYDTHFSGHVRTTSLNLWNTLSTLASLIQRPNENAPDKLDLDDVVILLNTEFGRTSEPEGAGGLDGGGRDHWQFGYVNVLIGGPVNANGGQARVAGAIDGAVAVQPFAPADVHCAVLLAAGINPFAQNNFNQGAISLPLMAPTDVAAALNIADRLLVG